MTERKKRKPGRPKGRKVTVAIQLRVPPDVSDALQRAAEAHSRNRTQEANVALKQYLQDIGFLLPSSGGEDGQS